MATKWVSLDKLRYAISKIHTLLQGKVDKVDGKGLSANDLTAALKGNYDAAYTHSQTAHAPAAAEKNIIVGVQVNGSDLAPDGSRKVNVRVPTGALAGKSQVSETDLDDALKEKVNSAAREITHTRTKPYWTRSSRPTWISSTGSLRARTNMYIPRAPAASTFQRAARPDRSSAGLPTARRCGARITTPNTPICPARRLLQRAKPVLFLLRLRAARQNIYAATARGRRLLTPNTVRPRSPPTASCRQRIRQNLTDSAQLLPTRSRAILPRCTVTRVLSQTLQSCLPPVRWRATSMTSRLRPPMARPARTLRGTAQPGMRSAVRSRSKSVPTLRSTRYSQTLPLDEVMLYEMGIASAVELRIVKNRGPLRAALSFPRCCHYCFRRIHAGGG